MPFFFKLIIGTVKYVRDAALRRNIVMEIFFTDKLSVKKFF